MLDILCLFSCVLFRFMGSRYISFAVLENYVVAVRDPTRNETNSTAEFLLILFSLFSLLHSINDKLSK